MDHSLYFVATPIGNLDDITFRAVDILQSVDRIYCEDTRVSKKLLDHYNIDTPLLNYHDHNKEQVTPDIITYIKKGHNVAIISDAGTPLISDPGFYIREELIKQEIPFTIIPGASAVISALTLSNIAPHPFYFHGFLDQKKSTRMRELSRLVDKVETLVFYESVHRVEKTIHDIYEVFGTRPLTIARELTKKFEEIIYTTTSSHIKLPTLKGEFVLVVGGNKQDPNAFDGTIIEEVNHYITQGQTEKQAIKTVAKRRNLIKNKVYMQYHNQKDKEK